MANVGFTRRFTQDPGLAVITAIEGVVIIDNDTPSVVLGGISGTACCVAEFEDGPFNDPTELASSSDFVHTLGSLGYTYAGVVANNVCARSRKADSALVPEFFNGNGYIATANKLFQRLICVRVDTSVGSVLFSRLAFVLGATALNFALVTGQILALKINGGGALNAIFTGVPATFNSGAGVYPSTFAGGESISFKIDGLSYTAVFLIGDQTQAQVVARMNAAAGYAAFAIVGGGVTSFTGRQGGTGGSVQITAVSGALVTTATGFPVAAATAGTGNVSNILQITPAELATIVQAAAAGSTVDTDINGALRVSNTGTPLTGTIAVDATTTALGLGFVLGDSSNAALGVDGTIPAGQRVKTGGGVEFVAMQTIAVTAANAGPYRVKVRHSLDDGTGASQLTAAITTVVSPIPLGSFSVSNDLPISAALTEPQLDAAYAAAFDTTLDISGVSKEINLIWSARQSNAIRNKVKQNEIAASQNGCQGRVGFIRPPLGTTTRAMARSTSAQPGVGAYRERGIVYCYPGAATLVPQIATRGLAGGAGFSADGIIDTGFDSWMVSICSQLNPEENPGQETTFADGIVSIERNNPDVQSMQMQDYILFKAAGICALRLDSGTAFAQSGVTSVDPAANPNQAPISQRRFSFYLQDSLAPVMGKYVKKLQTKDRRAQLYGECDGFLAGLKSGPPQRLEDYLLDGKSGNKPDALAAGVYRLIMKVRMLPDFADIVLDATVGTTVTITTT